LKDYIRVVTQTKNIITRKSISSLEETLPPQAFIRIHRSFIIALNKIESYNSEMVEVANKKLPISRMYKHEVGRVLKLEANVAEKDLQLMDYTERAIDFHGTKDVLTRKTCNGA
jgi:DNA-binding LytR/AlgR family response regulator